MSALFMLFPLGLTGCWENWGDDDTGDDDTGDDDTGDDDSGDDDSGSGYGHPDDVDVGADTDADGERKSSASKIPTWEEAMSYLLNKQPAETQSGTSSRSSSGRRRSRRGGKSANSTKST